MAIFSIRGAVGSGKSSFAASFKPKVNKFWMDLENGAIRALGRIPNWQEEHEIWQPFHETNDLEAILDRIDHNRGDQVQGREKYWNLITSKYVEKVQDKKYPILSGGNLMVVCPIVYTSWHYGFLIIIMCSSSTPLIPLFLLK